VGHVQDVWSTEESDEHFVLGDNGDLVAHAMPRRPRCVYDVWMPGPGTQPGGGSLVATISARDERWVVEPAVGTEMVCAEDDDMIYNEIQDAIHASVLAVLKARESAS
jgi:hypothetical protein